MTMTMRASASVVFKSFVGDDNVKPRVVVMGGEDFSRYGKTGIPICMYFLGTVDPARYEASLQSPAAVLPSTHNDSYAPVPEPSLTLGVRTMCMAVLNLVRKKD